MASIRHRVITPDELTFWKDAFEASLVEMRPHEELWAGIWREYQGQPGWEDKSVPFDLSSTIPTDRPWINYLLSQAQTVVASMVPRRPMFTFAAEQREQVEQQRVMGAAGNYFWRRNGSTKKVREIILDALICGHGVGKVVWDRPDEESAMHVPDYEDGAEGQPDELAGFDKKLQAQVRIADEALTGGASFSQDNTLPAVRRIPPWDFFRPAGQPEISDSPWTMERYTVLMTDLQDRDLFRLPKEMEADTIIRPVPLPEETFGTTDRARMEKPDAVTIFELHHWVKRRGGGRDRFTTYFWAPGGNAEGLQAIGSVADRLKMPGWPYKVLRFVKVPGSFFSSSISDLAAIRPIAIRLNDEIHYVLRQHRTNSKRKMIIAQGLATEDSLREFIEGDDENSVLTVNADDAKNAFAVVPEMRAPSDTEFVVSLLRQSMFEIGSVDSVQRGAAAASATATAARIADKGTQARSGLKQESLVEFLESVMDKQMAVFRQMSTKVQQVRIAGPKGPEFLDFDPQEIQGRFEVNVEVSSLVPRDPAAQQEQLISLISAINLIVQNIVPAVQAGILPPDVIKTTIERIFNIYGENPEAFMGPIGDIVGQITDGVRRPSPVSAEGGQAGPETPQPQPGPPALSAIAGGS